MQVNESPTLPPYFHQLKGRWGKLNARQTYNVVAQDLDRAICFAGFGVHEMAFLEQVREACWAQAILKGKDRGGAWPDAGGCTINLSDLARRTGIPRARWSEALRNLLASAVLTRDASGILRINKDAHEWVHPATDEPRLSARLLAFCGEVRPLEQATLAGFEAGPEAPRARPVARSPHQATTASGPDGGARRSVRGAHAGAYGGRTPERTGGARRSVRLPIEDRAREDSSKTDSKREETAPAPREDSKDRGITFGPTEPTPGHAPPPPVTGPGRDSDAAVKLQGWAAQHGEALGHFARQWCDDVPAEWVKILFQQRVVGRPAKSERAWVAYLGAILCDWLARGECEFLKGSTVTKAGECVTPEPAQPVAYPVYYLTQAEKKARMEAFERSGLTPAEFAERFPLTDSRRKGVAHAPAVAC